MHEYVTRAVVLDKETRNDADARYSFFTERFGKIVAKATSSRKIVSKLAGHLEPGTLAAVRIIEQHGTKVVDALKTARVSAPIAHLASLNNLLAEWEPDVVLWQEIVAMATKSNASAPATFSWPRMLAHLGWDPREAVCVSCGRGAPLQFHIPHQEFFCTSCTVSLKIPKSELLYM